MLGEWVGISVHIGFRRTHFHRRTLRPVRDSRSCTFFDFYFSATRSRDFVLYLTVKVMNDVMSPRIAAN